jgi:hypothetical protein
MRYRDKVFLKFWVKSAVKIFVIMFCLVNGIESVSNQEVIPSIMFMSMAAFVVLV